MTITLKSLVEEVRNLAAQRPNDRYEGVDGASCFYTLGTSFDSTCTPTGAGCIIGQAYVSLGGVFPDNILEEEGEGLESHGIRDALQYLDVDCESDYADYLTGWLVEVQGAQDGGTTWGRAVSIADLLMPEPMGGQ